MVLYDFGKPANTLSFQQFFSKNIITNKIELCEISALVGIIFLQDLILDVSCKGSCKDYVYDLETKSGNFHAGLGNTIVKNTDSVFIKTDTPNYKDIINLKAKTSLTKEEEDTIALLREEDLQFCFDFGKKLGEEITEALFDVPIQLEYEKVYQPILLVSKKRYIGNLYDTNPKQITKVDVKGLQMIKRDTVILSQRIQKTLLEKILIVDNKTVSHKIKDSIDYLKEELNKIRTGQVDINEIIMTKTLKKNYKNENVPHNVLAKILRERGTHNYQSNDRVNFVYIKGTNPLAKQYEKVEDPDYVIENNILIDYNYYILKQIRNSVLDLYEKLSKQEHLKHFYEEVYNLFVFFEESEKNDIKRHRLKIKEEKDLLKPPKPEKKPRVARIKRVKKSEE